MNAIEVVRRYNTAWNGRDADALVALFAEGGTFSNPHAGQGLTGEAIGNYAKAVWDAFPDMTVDKNAQRSKTVKVLSRGYVNESSGASTKAQFQKAGSS